MFSFLRNVFTEILTLLLRAVIVLERILRAVNRAHHTQLIILKELRKIRAEITPVDPAELVEFYEEKNGQLTKVDSMIRTDEQTDAVHLKLAIKDRKGKAAKVEGAPTWESSDETIATVVADEDGMGANVTPTGEVGECLVTAKADADLGEGVKEIVGTMPVVITAGEAVEMVIVEG